MKEFSRIAAICLCALVLVALDLWMIPLGIATGVLYACLVFLTGSSRYRHLPLMTAWGTSALIVVGAFGPKLEGVPIWMGITNRILGVVVVWVTLFFLLERRRAVEELEDARSGLEQRVEERTSQLAQVNKALVAEITERIDTETSLRASEAALESSRRALQQSQEELRALTASLLTAQEEERRRISRELHDDINQRLAMMVVELEALERAYPEAPAGLGSRLRSLQDNATELSEDVRHLAYQYHPSVLDDLGLAVALRRLVEDFSTRTGLPCTLHHCELPEALPPSIATCLYRITQEGLNNVAKHANATHVGVDVTRDNGMLALSISDDGKGLSPVPPARNGTGLGLASMNERVRLVKGALEIDSQPGRGTTIRARIPLAV